MSTYRVEIRIFGLLLFALISTWMLGVGLDASDVQGDILGIKFTVVGQIGAFIVLILIFFATGLFKFGLHNDSEQALNFPLDKLSLEDIESMLDELLIKSRKIERRKAKLDAAKAALEADSSPEQIMEAIGMRPVHRPRG